MIYLPEQILVAEKDAKQLDQAISASLQTYLVGSNGRYFSNLTICGFFQNSLDELRSRFNFYREKLNSFKKPIRERDQLLADFDKMQLGYKDLEEKVEKSSEHKTDTVITGNDALDIDNHPQLAELAQKMQAAREKYEEVNNQLIYELNQLFSNVVEDLAPIVNGVLKLQTVFFTSLKDIHSTINLDKIILPDSE